MSKAVTVDRDHWLGYRWSGHRLAEYADDANLDDLLLLGLQGNRQSNGEHALSQRTARVDNTAIGDAIAPGGPLVCMWSVRGAPHAHRAEQLDLVRDALAPLESDDGGARYVASVDEVATPLTRIVTTKTSKSDVSREVSRSVSPSLVTYCARCDATHVPEDVFRAAVRQAQLVVGPQEGRATMLHPRPRVEQQRVTNPRVTLLEAYFRVNGPATKTLYRDWQQAGSTGVANDWNDVAQPVVKVKVDSKRLDLPESLLDDLRTADSPEGVALLPPNDAYLRQTDRTLLVPDATRRRAVFEALSGPGALVVDGEIAGTWRYRRSAREITVEPFEQLAQSTRKSAEKRATAIAASTGDDEPQVTWT